MSALSFAFTKLIVSDLAAAENFYRAVFGMTPVNRVSTREHAFALEEVMLSPEGRQGAHLLILTRYLARPTPLAGAAWTGFVVADITSTLSVLQEMGGSIAVPVHENVEHRTLAAIAADPEGHLIELVQLLDPV